ncbi:MAG: DoxX family protein [Alphaproteobacteria bacterium]|uniref:DoxX family protein n=1 Tax=Pacificispira sp. TaxID=2888761 RepID=UPI002967876B|nr:DoxX family protein [Alphaproteobacteria bacterium]
MMKKFPWHHVLAVLLSAFFVLGGTLNLFPSAAVLADYKRWGYPAWFHYVTGAMEWSVAVLLLLPATRLVGCVVGGAVMTAAAATLLFHRQFGNALAPFGVLGCLILMVWLSRLQNQAPSGRD